MVKDQVIIIKADKVLVKLVKARSYKLDVSMAQYFRDAVREKLERDEKKEKAKA